MAAVVQLPPLHEAVITDDARQVVALLREGADISAVNSNQRTALHFAAAGSSCAVLEVLLRARCASGRRRRQR